MRPMRRERCPRCRRSVPVTTALAYRSHPGTPGGQRLCPGSRTKLSAAPEAVRPLSFWTGPNLWVDSGNL